MINRFTFDRWMEILANVPNSVLWLLDATEATKIRIGDHAEAPRAFSRSRLFFAPKLPHAHQPRALSPSPISSSTPFPTARTRRPRTRCGWGVPVLTLSGRLLRLARLRQPRAFGGACPNSSPPGHKILSPAASPSATIRPLSPNSRRSSLANRDTCTLFDMESLVTALEALYGDMCTDYRNGHLPCPGRRQPQRLSRSGGPRSTTTRKRCSPSRTITASTRPNSCVSIWRGR